MQNSFTPSPLPVKGDVTPTPTASAPKASKEERRTRVALFVGGALLGAALVMNVTAMVDNVESDNFGHFGDNTSGGSNIGLSTIADAPGGSVEYVSTEPTGDRIVVSTVSRGAGGSLAPEAPVKDDLSPIQGDVNESGNFGTSTGGSIAPEQVK